MQPGSSEVSDKSQFTNRKIRADYLKQVHVKLITPGGFEDILHAGCTEKSIAIAAPDTRLRIFHEACDSSIFITERCKRSGSQGVKTSVRDAGVQTLTRGTEDEYYNRYKDTGTSGGGCTPSLMRQQYLRTTRAMAGYPALNASDTSLSRAAHNRKSMTTVPPRQDFARESVKDVWKQNNTCFRNVDGSCGVSASHTSVNNASDPVCLKIPRTLLQRTTNVDPADFTKPVRYSSTLKAGNSSLLQGIPASRTGSRKLQSAYSLARSTVNSGQLSTGGDPCHVLEQFPAYLKAQCAPNDGQFQSELPPVEAQKPRISCVYKDGDVFVIRARDSVQNEDICLAPQQAGTALFAVPN